MLNNIFNKINSLEFRNKIILFLVIVFMILTIWNCYLTCQPKNNVIEKFTNVSDTRNSNFLPPYYWSHYLKEQPKRHFIELKIPDKIDINSNIGFCSLETIIPWSESTGGDIIQRVQLNNDLLIRYSIIVDGKWSWSQWKKLNIIDNQEELKAINNLTSFLTKLESLIKDKDLIVPGNLTVKGNIISDKNITSDADITCNGKLKVEGETLMNDNLLLNSWTGFHTQDKLTINTFNITSENLIVIGGKHSNGKVYWYTDTSNNKFPLGTQLYSAGNKAIDNKNLKALRFKFRTKTKTDKEWKKLHDMDYTLGDRWFRFEKKKY